MHEQLAKKISVEQRMGQYLHEGATKQKEKRIRRTLAQSVLSCWLLQMQVSPSLAPWGLSLPRARKPNIGKRLPYDGKKSVGTNDQNWGQCRRYQAKTSPQQLLGKRCPNGEHAKFMARPNMITLRFSTMERPRSGSSTSRRSTKQVPIQT